MVKDKKYNYYIFIDYSENIIGYNIIKENCINELLILSSRFEHYKDVKQKKLYVAHIRKIYHKKTIQNLFEKYNIKSKRKNLELFTEVYEFIIKNNNCILFISVDNNQYATFMKKFPSVKQVTIVKESQLKKNSMEYRLSLIIDNFLNIKRLEKSK